MNASRVLQNQTPATQPQSAAGRRMTGALQSGALVDRRYRILKVVGQGGFGAVYQARDERFQQHMVALKEMSDSPLSPPEKVKALQDFRQEAELLASLSHANLPKVTDSFEEASKAYLVMEFIEGQTLEKIQSDAHGPLDEQRVMNWALQLCAVLAYLHDQQVIFRDMKPSNVMITRGDLVRLIDFGIARIFKSSAKKDTTSLGSRGYAPFEQYAGQTDARSDIYALGATLYDLLTNTTPPDALARQTQYMPLEKPRQLNPNLSVASESIILRAMEMAKEKRFQTAGEMYQAIIDSRIVSSIGSHPSSLYGLSSVSTQVGTPPPQMTHAQSAPSLTPLSTVPQTMAGQPTQTAQPVQKGVSRRNILIGAAVLIAGGGGYALYRGLNSSQSNSRGAGSPQPISSGTVLSVDFYCSTEKQDWINAAATTFNNQQKNTPQGKTIQVYPRYGGSLALADILLHGKSFPAAWSPASSIEVDRFLTIWQSQHGNQEIILTSEQKTLVQSPLVFAIWKEYADLLLSKYGKIDWASIAQALHLPNGWQSIDPKQPQGNITFAQTNPTGSNSGLLTIVLMAYASYNRRGTLSVDDIKNSNFLSYLKLFEDAVTAFGRSSGTYLSNVVLTQGPAAYNITATYENLVLTAQNDVKRRYASEQFLPFYPSINIVSDHPFVLFQDKSIPQETQDAARAFRDFLLAAPQQQQALVYGLRPINADVHMTDKVQNNLFLTSNLQTYISSSYQQVPYPRREVIQELLNQWTAGYGGSPLATG